MRYFIIAFAAAAALGLGAAQAQQPRVKHHPSTAGYHRQPTSHEILAEGEDLGPQSNASYHTA